jgi:hypothetical protein
MGRARKGSTSKAIDRPALVMTDLQGKVGAISYAPKDFREIAGRKRFPAREKPVVERSALCFLDRRGKLSRVD